MHSDLIFDLGLHKGEDTDFYLKKGFRVAAFEANPYLVEACRARFADALGSGQLRLFAGAVSPKPGQSGAKIRFFINKRNSVWGTAVPEWKDRNAAFLGAGSEEVEVPVVSLPDVVSELGVPYFAKIDIEGMDTDILNVFGTFADRPQFVSIESEKVNFSHLEAEIALLSRLGYRRFMAVQQRNIPRSVIRTTTLQGAELTYRFEMHASGPFGEDLTGDWLTADEIVRRYRTVFQAYARYGDRSRLQSLFGRAPMATIERLTGYPLPGWYDTHARLQ